MNPEEMERLRELAQGATRWKEDDSPAARTTIVPWVRFTDAASPDAVLALLDEVERLRAALGTEEVDPDTP